MFKKVVTTSLVVPAFLFATPNEPSNLVLKAISSSSVSIHWNDNSSDESGFKIYRDDKLIKVVGTNVTTFVDSGLKANNSYKYTIKATDNYTKKPSFSKVAGVYNSAQTIALSSPNGADIYYTLDGKTPTINSTKYTSAIRVSQSSVIKAALFENGKRKSDVIVNSYIVNFDTDLPIISLSLDSKYLYDDYVGIYVVGKNGAYIDGCGVTSSGDKNYAQNWKRAVKVEYFNIDHQKEFSFGADLSIAGECSRNNAKKEFQIDLSSKYDTSSIRYKFFENKSDKTLQSFRLKTGSKGYEVGDLLTSYLVYDGFLNVDFQGDKPVQIFINGEYWGIYNMRESKDLEFISSNYSSVDTKNIDIVKVWEAKAGDMSDYNALLSYLRGSHSDAEKYNRVTQSVDIESFIDYLSVMIYSANSNWADDNTCWRSKDKNSPYNKWRWIIGDVNMGYKYSQVQNNTYQTILSPNNHTLLSEVFKTLVKDSSFISSFKRRFRDLINYTYTPENVLSVLDSMVDKRKYEMSDSGKYNYPTKFNTHIEDVRDFINKRNDLMIKGLEDF